MRPCAYGDPIPYVGALAAHTPRKLGRGDLRNEPVHSKIPGRDVSVTQEVPLWTATVISPRSRFEPD